jgi:NhaA family Na+:H+ antiporter
MFAFFSAGVVIGGTTGLSEALGSPLSLGIVAALVIGKPVGIVVTTWLLTRLEHVRLDPALRWVDIVGVGLLGGMGFTVSLLVDDLSFASGSPENDYAKVAIFAASVISAVLAAIVLGSRNRRYLRAEQNDGDADAREIPE